MMAVVKSDAYGAGIRGAGHFLEHGGNVRRGNFGRSALDQGKGVRMPILVLHIPLEYSDCSLVRYFSDRLL